MFYSILLLVDGGSYQELLFYSLYLYLYSLGVYCWMAGLGTTVVVVVVVEVKCTPSTALEEKVSGLHFY